MDEEERDDLERSVARRTERNPNFPALLEAAERRVAERRAAEARAAENRAGRLLPRVGRATVRIVRRRGVGA